MYRLCFPTLVRHGIQAINCKSWREWAAFYACEISGRQNITSKVVDNVSGYSGMYIVCFPTCLFFQSPIQGLLQPFNNTSVIHASYVGSSQAAWQGLAVLMASAVVVLKRGTSTLRQRHYFISIDLTFGVSDYVREVTSPDKVGSGLMNGRDTTWGQHIRVLWLFFQQSFSPYLWTNFCA